ncbi:hypothetical protein LCGC14_0412520 [marine sediment metagenome]|uniref:Uncharacterized protein n=1 Tax=marine sediment metagenome TaxID=412755 RepID=A0A0F9VFG8_9ZZZZ
MPKKKAPRKPSANYSAHMCSSYSAHARGLSITVPRKPCQECKALGDKDLKGEDNLRRLSALFSQAVDEFNVAIKALNRGKTVEAEALARETNEAAEDAFAAWFDALVTTPQ